MVADTDKEPDSLEARFAALTPEQRLAALSGKLFIKKKKGDGVVKKIGATGGKGPLDPSNSFLCRAGPRCGRARVHPCACTNRMDQATRVRTAHAHEDPGSEWLQL